MGLYDLYEEMEAPVRAFDFNHLQRLCEILNRDHLEVRNYLGLSEGLEEFLCKLNILLSEGYIIKSIRRHCITGIHRADIGKRCYVIGIALSKGGQKKLDYIDYIAMHEDFDGYENDIPIPEELFDELMLRLGIKDEFSKRTETSQVWYPNSIFRRNLEQ